MVDGNHWITGKLVVDVMIDGNHCMTGKLVVVGIVGDNEQFEKDWALLKMFSFGNDE